MTLLLPITSTSMPPGSSASGRPRRFASAATSSVARVTTGTLRITCISLPSSCSHSLKIWRSGRSTLCRSPRFTRMRPCDWKYVGVVNATTITVAVVTRNRPRMIHLRRNSTARNSRAVACRAGAGAVGGVGLLMWPFSSLPDDARHEHAVQIEELPSHEHAGERVADRSEELLREHIQVPDEGTRHEHDVEAAHDGVREIVTPQQLVQVHALHRHGARAVAMEQQHAVALRIVRQSASGGDRLHHGHERT